MRTCTEPDCGRSFLARGLCRIHYDRLWKRGALPPKPPIPRCEFPGCDRDRRASGLCKWHYNAKARGRALRPLRPLFTSREALFWSKVNQGGPVHLTLGTACWPWTGSVNRSGYGKTTWDGRHDAAHRRSWTITHGPIPAGLHVLHRCDNPPCVNPAHLFLGTHQDNTDDRKRKGRNHLCGASGARNGSKTRPDRTLRGEAVSGSKLTGAQVLAIRAEYVPRKTSQASIAVRYGISKATVGLVVTGRVWKHVDGERHRGVVSEEVRAAVREEYRPGEVSQAALSTKYGISQSAVSSIVRRR